MAKKVDVTELRAWAKSRIDHCRRLEEKFSVGSMAEIEATTERRALTAVLNLLAEAQAEERSG